MAARSSVAVDIPVVVDSFEGPPHLDMEIHLAGHQTSQPDFGVQMMEPDMDLNLAVVEHRSEVVHHNFVGNCCAQLWPVVAHSCFGHSGGNLVVD